MIMNKKNKNVMIIFKIFNKYLIKIMINYKINIYKKNVFVVFIYYL